MSLQAVIFDWGGTLSEFVPLELLDVWRLAAHHLAPEREDELAERLLAVEAEFWATVTSTQRSGTLSELLAKAASDLGLDVGEALLEEAATRHLDAWTPHIRHDPDAAGTLEALRGQGLRIGLLSNTHWPRTFHERFLERDGLDGLIDARLYTSELEFQKPHPSAFHAALRALGLSPGESATVAFVGDRLLDDVAGAKGVGMRAVWRTNPLVPAHDVEPDAVIERLPELLDVVKRWSE